MRKYAEMYRRSLKEANPDLYQKMLRDGVLEREARERGERAGLQFMDLIARLQRQTPGPQDSLGRAQHLTVLASQADELIVPELLEGIEPSEDATTT